ncbi:unnamed protein product [Absidia cylindrospora]
MPHHQPCYDMLAGLDDLHSDNVNRFSGIPANSAQYENNIYAHKQHALDDFLQHALKNDCPPPEYDMDMMQRLNTISYIMQQNQDDFILPVSTSNEINALQTWLEQLSAKIQTNSRIYPDPTASPVQHSATTHLQHPAYSNLIMTTGIANSNTELIQCSNDHSSLYPSCDNIDHEETTKQEPPSQSYTQSSSAPPPTSTNAPSSISSTSTINTTSTTINISNDNHHEISPLFWKPGPNPLTSTVEVPAIDGPAPSEEIDFTPEYMHQQHQPTTSFETEKSDVKHISVPGNKIDTSFDGKKEMMQMINVFTSPTQNNSDSTTSKKDHKVDDNSTDNIADDSVDMDDLDSFTRTDSIVDKNAPPCVSKPAAMTLSSPTEPDTATRLSLLDNDDDESEDGTSPYDDLVDHLRNVSLQSENEDSKLRQRHSQLVDLLWQATLRLTIPPPKPYTHLNLRPPNIYQV